jgi:hypothetical protein
MVRRLTTIFVVSVYLAVIGCFLVLTGRIRVSLRGFGRKLLGILRPAFRADLLEMTHEEGYCYAAHLDKALISDLDGRSRLVVFENGKALHHPHSNHDDIREFGAGRFSHWGKVIYFSASDNSNPTTNGRWYSVKEI